LPKSPSTTAIEFTSSAGEPVLVNLRLVRHATEIEPGGTRITFDSADIITIQEDFSVFRDLMMAALDDD
jgi:hypothetical protein